MAQQGEADVQAQMVAGQGNRSPIRIVRPNRVAPHLISGVRASKRKPDDLFSVVKVNNAGMTARQAISLMAAASEIEGREHPFRRTAARLRSANKLNAAELLKGIS
jgi:hypothetical protein